LQLLSTATLFKFTSLGCQCPYGWPICEIYIHTSGRRSIFPPLDCNIPHCPGSCGHEPKPAHTRRQFLIVWLVAYDSRSFIIQILAAERCSVHWLIWVTGRDVSEFYHHHHHNHNHHRHRHHIVTEFENAISDQFPMVGCTAS
jgi:hypothetical protein